MHLYIFGFLPDDNEDDSLKYQLKIDTTLNERIVKLLGHKNHQCDGGRRLDAYQRPGNSTIWRNKAATTR
jgi:hypothetical protein